MDREKRKQDYLAKLRDPRWQKVRLQILERDHWECQKCGDSKSTLHVHHKWYGGMEPWEYPPESLIALCADCHEAESLDIKNASHDVVQSLKILGAMADDMGDICAALGSLGHKPINGQADTWSIVAWVLGVVLQGARDDSDSWRTFRAAYYAGLKHRNANGGKE